MVDSSFPPVDLRNDSQLKAAEKANPYSEENLNWLKIRRVENSEFHLGQNPRIYCEQNVNFSSAFTKRSQI